MKNKIPMAGRIKQCWLFVYRVPSNQLGSLLPKPLDLVTKGDYGFLNIVVSGLSHMRPALSPFGFGLSYWHVAYRLHADYRGNGGLFFLRSDANSPLICATGNLVTDFKFHRAEVRVSAGHIKVIAPGANADAVVSSSDQTTLQLGSPFDSLDEAADFLKYKPAALAVRKGSVMRLPIRRDEAAWQSRLAHVERASFEFLERFDASFELCYEMKPIDYIWDAEEVVR